MSRIIKGAQISLLVSVVVIAISGVIGTVLGIMASYFGGWVDYLISRIIDVAMALPVILIALVLVVVVGPGLKVLVIVITGVLWSRYARLVRGETLSIMSQDFINLARVAGSSHLYIMARHVFPNVFNSLIVLATLQVGYVIIIESALSFIGVGIPRPTPSWGSIVADGRDLIIQAAWWVSLFPGLAIVLTVLSVNLVGGLAARPARSKVEADLKRPLKEACREKTSEYHLAPGCPDLRINSRSIVRWRRHIRAGAYRTTSSDSYRGAGSGGDLSSYCSSGSHTRSSGSRGGAEAPAGSGGGRPRK